MYKKLETKIETLQKQIYTWSLADAFKFLVYTVIKNNKNSQF